MRILRRRFSSSSTIPTRTWPRRRKASPQFSRCRSPPRGWSPPSPEARTRRLYAEQHGITIDTVKFHLKTAFEKTGSRSQARLLQAVARAFADLNARRRADE